VHPNLDIILCIYECFLELANSILNHKYQQQVVAHTSQNIGGAVEMSVNKSYLHISLVNPFTGNMLYFILLCLMPANFTVLLVEKIALQHFPI
jgi:hypothetical protein